MVLLSRQESNPKVQGYRENFNTGNAAQIFLWPSIHVGTMPFHFWKFFQCHNFHRHRQLHRHPCPGHTSKNEKLEKIEKKNI